MRQSGGGDGLADYGCLEEMAMMTPGRSVLGRRDREREDPPDGQGIGTMAGQKARTVVASHMPEGRGDQAQIGKGLSDG